MAELVNGEASESDEEVNNTSKIFAAEIPGEGSETDEDVYEQRKTASMTSTASIYRNNLLQRKLIENNIAIWKALNNLTRNFVVSASKQLLTTDQMLIKSQVSMQAAHASLRQAQRNAAQLQTKTAASLTGSFIPVIRVKNAKTSI